MMKISMQYFTKKTIEFFEHLAWDNSKEWFDENRQRYHDEVKDRFDHYLRDLITEVHKDDPRIMIEPKHAKFRINRDIRFSKNKQPYKLHVSAVISQWGRKDMVNPGLYIQLGHNGVHIGTGFYSPTKEHLYAIREAIVAQPKKITNIIHDPLFAEVFGSLKWLKNKRIPKEFRETAERYPLLYNKQFYFYTTYPDSTMLKKDFLAFTMKHWEISKHRRQFIAKALEEFS